MITYPRLIVSQGWIARVAKFNSDHLRDPAAFQQKLSQNHFNSVYHITKELPADLSSEVEGAFHHHLQSRNIHPPPVNDLSRHAN